MSSKWYRILFTLMVLGLLFFSGFSLSESQRKAMDSGCCSSGIGRDEIVNDN